MTQGLMRRCAKCEAYTLKDTCPECGGKAGDPRPAKFSPEDHYGEYRRKLKRLSKTQPAS